MNDCSHHQVGPNAMTSLVPSPCFRRVGMAVHLWFQIICFVLGRGVGFPLSAQADDTAAREQCARRVASQWIAENYPESSSHVGPRQADSRTRYRELSSEDILPSDEDMVTEAARNRLPNPRPIYVEDIMAPGVRPNPSEAARLEVDAARGRASIAGGIEVLPNSLGGTAFPFPSVEAVPRPLTPQQISHVVSGGDSRRPMGQGGNRRAFVLAGTEGLEAPILMKIPRGWRPQDQLHEQAAVLAYQRSREMGLMEGLERHRAHLPQGPVETRTQFEALNRDTRHMLRELGISTYQEYQRAVASGRMRPLVSLHYETAMPFSREEQFQALPESTRRRLADIGVHSLRDATRLGMTLAPMVEGMPLGRWIAAHPFSLENAQDYHVIYEVVRQLEAVDAELARMTHRRFRRYVGHYEHLLGNEGSSRHLRDQGDGDEEMPNRPAGAFRDQDSGEWTVLRVNGVDYGPSNMERDPRRAFNNLFVRRDSQGRLRVVIIDI